MRVVTAAEIAELDRQATENHGIPVAQLMDTAGRRVAQAAELLLRERGGRRVVVLAGKGNNGGDGLVGARHLRGSGAGGTGVLGAQKQELGGEARRALAAAPGAAVAVRIWDAAPRPSQI